MGDVLHACGAVMSDLVARCRAALPELVVDADAFVAHVMARKPAELTDEAWVASAHADDLYVACGCLTGDPAAVRELETRFGAHVDGALRSMAPAERDDARQILRQRLLVGGKLASYTGRGPLRRWLRVVASRLLLEVVGARAVIADEWQIAALPAGGDDPELAYIKARYRAAYKQAFADAYAQLGDRERTVLAQYHVDRLTIDDLGELYGVHRVTASRWVARAEADVRELVLGLLRERLGTSHTELEHLTRLVRSQLSLSLASL